MGSLQLTYQPKLKTIHSHEAKVVQLWLSTDPLAEKFPNASPYNYCLNNPLIFVDPDGKAPNPPKWLKNFWREVKQTLKDDFSSYKVNKFNKDVIEPIKSIAEKLDNLILSIPQEKNDKLQGNSKGHFKRGINFINKEKNDPAVKRGLETANYAEKVEDMDIDIFGLSTNGLQSIGDGLLGHPNRIIDAIDNIGSSIDAGYSTKGAYSDLKEANKEETRTDKTEMVQTFNDPKGLNNRYERKDIYDKRQKQNNDK
ncbi:hypothetical protein [Flavobacterium covae]|uniref:hypothetical protein n=1 Tax=Flavobacterium covae TaxID=2906076 RepID=UPI00339109D9